MAKPVATPAPTDQISAIAQEVLVLVSELPVKATSDPMRRFRIATDAEAEAGTAWLAKARKKLKQWEAFFSSLLKPFREAMANHNRQRDNLLRDLRQYEEDLDTEIKAHRRREAQKAATAQAKLDAQYEKRVDRAVEQGKDPALVKPPPVVVAPVKTVQTEAGTVTFRKQRQFKVLDPNQVPEEYWVIDEVKIGKAVRAGIDVPGCHIWEEEISAVR